MESPGSSKKSDNLSLCTTLKKYLALCTLQDKVLMFVGLIAGVLNGILLVSRLFVYAMIIDVLQDALTFEKQLSNENLSFRVNIMEVKIEQNCSISIENSEKRHWVDIFSFQYTMNIVTIVYGAMLVCAFFLGWIQVLTWETVCRRQTRRLRNAFFEHALRLEMSWHDQMERSDDLNVRLNDEIERVQSTLGSRVPFMVQCMTTVPLSIVYTFYVNWMLGTAVLAGIIIVFSCTSLTGKIVRKIASEEQKNSREAGYIVSEILTSIKIVKSFGGEEREIQKYTDHVTNERKIALRKNFALAFQYGLVNSVLFLILAGCIYIGAYCLETNTIGFGLMVSSIGCFRQTSSAFSDTLPFLGDLIETLASCSNVFAFLETPIIIDPTSDKGIKVDDLSGDVCFKNVTFHYPSRKDTKILHNFNMTIPKGKVVAIVGESGAGKTTILSLIMRFFDPISGEVSINGTKISEMSVDSFRRRMGVVSQEPVLFDGTIEENIRYGNMGASLEQIKHAAMLANAHYFITKLPQGYSTMVGERGSTLSGGQKQRLVIARALIRDPDILLLDEATSALDNHSERAIQATLDEVSKGRTTVIISHKLNAIKNADVIFVMKNGRLVENGNHHQLLSKRGTYYSLINQQNHGRDGIEVDTCAYERPMKRSISERFSFNRKSFELSVDSKRSSVDLGFDLNNVCGYSFTSEETSPGISGWSMFLAILGMSNGWVITLGLILCLTSGLAIPSFYVMYVRRVLEISSEPIYAMIDEFKLISLRFVYVAVALFMIFLFGINCAARTADDTIATLRIKMLKSALSQRYSYFDAAVTSPTNIANAINQKPFQFKNIGGTKAGDLCSVFVFAITAFTLSFFNSWRMALIQLMFVPFAVLCSYLQVKSKLFVQRRKDEKARDSSKFAALCFDNIKAVHFLSLHKLLNDRYRSLWNDAGNEEFKALNVASVTFGMMNAMPFVIAVLNCSVGYSWVLEGKEELESLAMNIPLFSILFNSIGGVILYLHNLGSSMPSIKSALHMINIARKPIGENEPPKKIEIQGRIQFKNVSFSYDDSKQDGRVLKGLNLTIEPGTAVALVGPSGCGKSTIINLIEKFYDADDGIILVDGKDIRLISDENMRASIGLVTQEPLLFNTTIRGNILYGLRTSDNLVTEERLIHCCKQANIHKFIRSLPLGYDTVVGARGSQLSGGQKQRIAIARALIRDPKILLLDEATSALDSESEKEVQAALNDASKGRTTITVAHRLSTIKEANVIAVMNNGMIVEIGSHDELVELGGRYYEMLMDQC